MCFFFSKKTLLIKSGNKQVLDEVTSWKERSKIDENRLKVFVTEGHTFLLENQGTSAILESEKLATKKSTSQNSLRTNLYSHNFFLSVKPNEYGIYYFAVLI